MVEYEKLREAVKKQAEKAWDTKSIGDWFSRIAKDGIASKKIDPKGLVIDKPRILELVQRRAEECTYLGHV